MPMTPVLAQRTSPIAIAVQHLPTRGGVDQIWAGPASRSNSIPSRSPLSDQMTTIPVMFHAPTNTVQEQRTPPRRSIHWGTLVAGHKKEMSSCRTGLTTNPRIKKQDHRRVVMLWLATIKVGESHPTGTAGHDEFMPDYSHGIRAVRGHGSWS